MPDVEKLFLRSLNYMIEEIARTSVYYNWYKSPAVCPGPYFDGPNLFNRQNPIVDLSVPTQCIVEFDDLRKQAA